MKLPAIHGFIDRRILANYTADPEVVQRLLPPPFRPRLHRSKAIVGICLIRLLDIKPKGFSHLPGIHSENGAHRFAVEWEENGKTLTGVYIPRRDTSLRLNAWAGGRLFPGKHIHAHFDVEEANGNYHIAFKSTDQTSVQLEAKETDHFPESSIFTNLEEASAFFRKGNLGYSPNKNRLEGLNLNTYTWAVQPLEVTAIRSSFFENPTLFPPNSIQFDNALLMRRIEHEWTSMPAKQIRNFNSTFADQEKDVNE